MKVAIIIERADVILGGAERSVFETASALSSRGVEVDILAASGSGCAKNIRILCGHLRGRRTGFYDFADCLKRHLLENSYDIVHSVLPFDFADIYQPRGGSYVEAISQNAASYPGKVTQFYKRLTAFANVRRNTLFAAERRLCKNPAGPLVVALSEYVKQQFRRHYKLEERRMVVIPNGVKTDEGANNAQVERLRGQIFNMLGPGHSNRPYFLLFVANNFRLKGLSFLIKAIQLASEQKPARDIYLIAAGRDKSQRYRHQAKSCGVDGRIIFLGSVRDIQDVLSIADVAVLPTFYDPSSRFILEALAAGQPVITTRFNGAAELFEDHRHGRVINSPRNVKDLAEAICYFSDRENVKKTSEAIKADNLREKVSIDRVARQLIELYGSIVKEADGQK